MTADLFIRITAVVVAVLLIAAPNLKGVPAALARAWKLIAAHGVDIARIAGGLLLVAVAWRGMPVDPKQALPILHLLVGAGAVGCALFLLAGQAMNNQRRLPAWVNDVLLLASGGLLLASTPLPRIPIRLPTMQATAAVYVYEKDDTAVPPFVLAAIDRLNREQKITATLLEVDTVDGQSQVPDQYKPVVDAARPLPAFVVLSGSSVIKVTPSPKDEEDLAL